MISSNLYFPDLDRKKLFELLFGAVLIHFVIAVSFAFGFATFNVAIVWPAAGVYLWLAYRHGVWAFPAIFIGDYSYPFMTWDYNPVYLGITFFNAGSAVIAGCIARRAVAKQSKNDFLPYVIQVFLVASFILSAITAALNTALIGWYNDLPLSLIGTIGVRWFLSDLAGALSLAPLLITMSKHSNFPELFRGVGYAVLVISILWMMSLSPLSFLSESGAIVLLVTPIIIYIALTSTFSTLYAVTLLLSLGSIGVVLVTAEAATDSTILEMALFQIVIMGTSYILSAIQRHNSHVTAELAAERTTLEKRVQERTHDLEIAKEKAEDADRSKSEFLANMSHEIRTPLNGVVGMANVLAESELSVEQQNQVDIIIESGNTLSVTLNDILDFSKIEAGKLDIAPITGSLEATLRHVFNLFQPQAEAKKIELVFDIDEKIPKNLIFDPIRLRQCTSNLLSNALKFTNSGGVKLSAKVIELDEESAHIEIMISDTGIGISPNALSTLFEAFSQAETSTTRNYGGTGLGLTITKQLTELMKGELSVSSTLGKGSEFKLNFNFKSVEHLAPPRKTQPLTDNLSGIKILVVDDNNVNQIIAKAMLKQLRTEASLAENGLEALEILAKEEIDLVLLDIHMPVMDGPETVARIRGSSEPWTNIPVIALTADAMSGNAEKFISMGMDGYLSKPIEKTRLLIEIQRVMAK